MYLCICSEILVLDITWEQHRVAKRRRFLKTDMFAMHENIVVALPNNKKKRREYSSQNLLLYTWSNINMGRDQLAIKDT